MMDRYNLHFLKLFMGFFLLGKEINFPTPIVEIGLHYSELLTIFIAGDSLLFLNG